MTPAAVLALALTQPAIAPPSPPADRCLPGDEGFLSMRLRGSIDEEIRWREPILDCTGMSRPDGRGLRLRFAGPRDGGELAIVFAAPELAMGASARGVPVNITLLDEAGQRIYGTQGDRLCMLDAVEQQAIEGAGLPPLSFRVSARGFCTAPARAVDGDGAVLLTRFDFAGLVSYREDEGPASRPPPQLAGLPESGLVVETATGKHRFRVWVAGDAVSRERGLMFVREMDADRGMLFLFDWPQYTAFWMKDTYLSLDLVFIGADGRVVNIARDAKPLSLAPIESVAPVKAVLELAGGTAARIGLEVEDRVLYREQRGGKRGAETKSQMPAKPTLN